MLSANPDLPVTSLRTALVSSADVTIVASDSAGGVDADAAVRAILPAPDPMPSIPGDVDEDGEVGFSDFLAVSQNYNRPADSRADGDLTADGKVDFKDFLLVSRNYGRTAHAFPAQQDQAIDAVHALNLDFGEEGL